MYQGSNYCRVEDGQLSAKRKTAYIISTASFDAAITSYCWNTETGRRRPYYSNITYSAAIHCMLLCCACLTHSNTITVALIRFSCELYPNVLSKATPRSAEQSSKCRRGWQGRMPWYGRHQTTPNRHDRLIIRLHAITLYINRLYNRHSI